MRTGRIASVLVVALAAAVAAQGCGRLPGDSGPQRRNVVGIVTNVRGSSPTDVSEFTLRTSDGRVLTFEVGEVELGGAAFPAGHLREHQANATPVVVTYVERGSGLQAVRLRDAP